MGATTERFKKLIKDKKDALAGLQGQALIDATAEVVYLDYTFHKRIKDTGNENVWDGSGMKKVFNAQIAKGNYNDIRKARIDQIKKNIPVLMERLAPKDPNAQLPEELYEYALDPEKLTNEKMATIRAELYKKGYQFDVLAKPDEGVIEEQKDALGKEMRMMTTVNLENRALITSYFGKPGIAEKMENYTERCGFLTRRPSTDGCTFLVYLIGEKGYTYKDACAIIPGHKDFEPLAQEFISFLKNHPVKPLPDGVAEDEENIAVSPEQAKENALAIMGMMNKCGAYFAQFKIPDVDYNDLEAVEAVKDEFAGMANFMQDFGQQQEHFLNQETQVVKELPKERKACFEAMEPAYQIADFAKNFDIAFSLNKEDRTLEVKPSSYAKIAAVNRYLFAKRTNEQFRGKTGKQLQETSTVKDLYLWNLSVLLVGKSLMYTEMTDDVVMQYLRTGEGPFADMVEARINEESDMLREEFNRDNTANATSIALNELSSNSDTELKQRLKTTLHSLVGDENKTGQEVLHDYLEFDEKPLAEATGCCNKFFDKLFVDSSRYAVLKKAGVNDPLTLIKIDGKTPEELWGDKYKDFSAQDKKEILRLEVVNAVLQGDKRVSVDNFVITENDELVPGKPYIIVESDYNLERTKDFLREVDDLHGLAESVKRDLDHPDFSVDTGLQPIYDEMKTALNKLSEEANVSGKGTVASLSEAWKQYQLYADQYYTNRIALHQQQNGTVEELRAIEGQREKVYNKLADQFSYAISKYKGLEDLFTPNAYEGPESGSFGKVYDRLKNLADRRGYKENKTRLHGEVSDPLPQEFAFLNDVDDLDESFNLNDPQGSLLLSKAGIKPGIYDLELKAHESFVGNLDSMRNTDHTDIIGKNPNVEENDTRAAMTQFLNKQGISGRATAQSYFMFYCAGVKGLSIQETLQLGHAHDKDGKGNYLNPEAHAKALEYEKDFLKFVKKYPADPAKDSMSKNDSLEGGKKWLELFKGFTEKYKEYTWPDIDYSDPKQVEAHYNELYAIDVLAGDGFQELERIIKAKGYNQYRSMTATGAEVFGSEEEFWKTRQFYGTMQSVTATAFRKGYTASKYMPEETNPNQTYVFAEVVKNKAYQIVSGEFMSTFAGKTIGKSYDENTFKVLYSGQYSVEWANIVSGITETSMAVGSQGLPAQIFGNHILNNNKNEYKEWLDQYKNGLDDFIRQERYPKEAIDYALKCRTQGMPEEFRSAIAAVDDNPESMINFLNSPVGERNGLDGVLALSEGWFDFYEHNLLYMQGAKESDLFLIQRPDGKFVSPKEVWGEKYANVEDPVLKENLFRAEILKCIAVGKPALATRGVTITNNNQIGFSDPVVLYLPKEQMTKMFDAYLRYKAKKANLLDNLKDVKRRLSAMEPKDAVFGEEGGSTKYVAFTKSVNEAIAALERSNFGEKPGQFDRICEKLHALETNADAYYEEVKNSKDANDKERAYLAGKASGSFAAILAEERNVFTNNMMATAKQTFAEVNEYLLDAAMKNLKTQLKIGDPKEDLRNSKLLEKTEDAYVREQIEICLKNLRESDEYKKVMSSKEKTDEKLALTYLETRYSNLLKPTLPGKEPRLLKASDLRGAENMLHDYPIYANNVLFTSNMKKDPDKTIQEWEKVEESAETLRINYQSILDKNITSAGSLDRYVAGLNADEEKGKDLADMVSANKRNQNIVDRETKEFEMNHLLASVVWLQILVKDDEVSRQIREGIINNPNNYALYQNAIEELFDKNNVLGSYDNATKAIKHLENGRLRDDTLKILQESAAEYMKSIEETKKADADAKLNEFKTKYASLYNGGPHVLTAQEAELIKTSAGMEFENAMEQKYKNTASLLKGEIHYTENGENKQFKAGSKAFAHVRLEDTKSQTMFLLYLMAKKDMSFEQAVELNNRVEVRDQNNNVTNADAMNELNAARAEFAQFVVANPLERVSEEVEPLSDQAIENASRNWAEIYAVATQKFKAFKVPELDYRNQAEVKKNLPLLTAFAYVANETSSMLSNQVKATNGTSNGTDVRRFFTDTFGGEDKYRELSNFWYGIMIPAKALHSGYIKIIPVSNAVDEFDDVVEFNRITGIAGARYYTGKAMQQIKGMTVEQASQYMLNHPYSTYFANMNASIFRNDRGNNGISTNIIETAKFLEGIPSKKFEQDVEKYEQERRERLEKETITDIASSAFGGSNRIDWGDAMAVLQNLPDDDLDAKLAFLKNKGHYTMETYSVRHDRVVDRHPVLLSGKDFVSRTVNDLLNNIDQNAAFEQIGIKQLDAFLVDGQTPSEKWKDRYQDLDEKQREELLYLDVIREIALGRSNVQIRGCEIKDGKYVEGKPLLVSPKRDANFMQILDNAHAYEFGRDDILEQLKANRTELIANQLGDNTSNFFNDPDTGEIRETGSKEYKEFTRSLRTLINTLEFDKNQNPIDKQRILDEFDTLIAKSRRYYETHSGSLVKGFWHDYGINRKNISRRMIDSVQKLKQDYLNYRKSMECDYIAEDGKTFRDSDYAAIKSAVDTVEKTYNIPKKDNNYYLNVHKRNVFKRLYRDFLQKPVVVSAADKPQYDRVNRYYSKLLQNVVRTGRVPDNVPMKPEELEKQFHDLAKNPVFQNIMASDPNNCVDRWHEVEAGLQAVQTLQTNSMNAINRLGVPTATVLGMGPLAENQNPFTMNDVLRKFDTMQENFGNGIVDDTDSDIPDEDAENPEVANTYNNAAHVIVMQILNSDTDVSKQLHYAIAASNAGLAKPANLLDVIEENIMDNLSQNGVFGPNRAHTTLKKINDGSLAKEYANEITSFVPELRGIMLQPMPDENVIVNEQNQQEIQELLKDDTVPQVDVVQPVAEPVVKNDEALVQQGWVFVEPQPKAGADILLDQPKPKAVPIAVGVIQPIVPANEAPHIQHAVVNVNLPIVNEQVLVPEQPIAPVVLPPVREEVPNQQLIEQAIPQIINQQNPNEAVIELPVFPALNLYKPEPQPQPKPVVNQNQINEPKPAVNQNQINKPENIFAKKVNVLPEPDGKVADWKNGKLPAANDLSQSMANKGYSQKAILTTLNLLNTLNKLDRHVQAVALKDGKDVNTVRKELPEMVTTMMDSAEKLVNIAMTKYLAENQKMPYEKEADGINRKLGDAIQKKMKLLDLDQVVNGANQNKINIPTQQTDNFDIMNFVSEEELTYNLNPATFSGKGPNKFSMAALPRNSWEFPYERKGAKKVASDKILNTGDSDAILDYLDNNKNLSNAEREKLQRQADANIKIRGEIEKSAMKISNGNFPGGRLSVRKTKNNGVEILGTNQKQYQTSDYGCWSCSANLLLQSRGITSLTQEDIRLFRSFDDFTTTNDGEDAYKAYNKDISNNMIEAGDLLTRLAPDSMVREMEIHKRPANSKLSDAEYEKKALDMMSKEIFTAIEKEKSPVSLLRFGHYVTIVGIENRNGIPWIKYKNSVHRDGTAMDPNVAVWEKLSDVLGDSFKSSAPENRAVSITWMADIKMDPKTGKIMNVPSDRVSVNTDGELQVPDDAIQSNTEQVFKCTRQVSGKVIAKLGGEERSDFNLMSKDGLAYSEKAYVGKKLDYNFLQKKAAMSPFEEGVERAKERLQFYDKIDPKKDAKSKELFDDKVQCVALLATESLMKHTMKVPLSDEAAAKKAWETCIKKENVSVWKNKAKSMSGKEILKAAEDGTLIGLDKQIKNPDLNNNPVK